MRCRHVEPHQLPGPFEGTDWRCRLTDERYNPKAFAAAREVLVRTGKSAGQTCPYAVEEIFASCSMFEPADGPETQ